MNSEYDRFDPKSIEKYAQGLIGRTFRNVVENDTYSVSGVVDDGGFNKKGGLGVLLEER